MMRGTFANVRIKNLMLPTLPDGSREESSLVGMGVLPLQFKGGDSWQSLGLAGNESIDIELPAPITPQSDAVLVITGADGSVRRVTALLRIDTPIEVEYHAHGGILPYVLRQLLAA